MTQYRAVPERFRIAFSFAKTMAILAIISISPERYEKMESLLRATLARHSYLFWPLAQRDIIEVLEAIGNPQAAALAQAWRPFYAGFRK